VAQVNIPVAFVLGKMFIKRDISARMETCFYILDWPVAFKVRRDNSVASAIFTKFGMIFQQRNRRARNGHLLGLGHGLGGSVTGGPDTENTKYLHVTSLNVVRGKAYARRRRCWRCVRARATEFLSAVGREKRFTHHGGVQNVRCCKRRILSVLRKFSAQYVL
jgi:hypothetical protein